jgi:hypothetical protein
MFIRFTRKNAVLAALGLSAMAGMSAPASAQVMPHVQTCTATFSGLAGNTTKEFACGAVRVQLRKVVRETCGPLHCEISYDHQMRARRVPLPGLNVISAQAFSIRPDTCRPALTTAFSPWCSMGRTAPLGGVQMISVTIPAQ